MQLRCRPVLLDKNAANETDSAFSGDLAHHLRNVPTPEPQDLRKVPGAPAGPLRASCCATTVRILF